jgi:hypothetical protein
VLAWSDGRLECIGGRSVTANAAGGTTETKPVSNISPLRPIRVLLAGREARYLRALAFLLERRGYQTRLSYRPDALLADAHTFQPEVAILVEADSFGDIVGQAMSLITERERLTVIVATSRSDAPDSNQLRFVPKWGPFAALAEAVERAWVGLPQV